MGRTFILRGKLDADPEQGLPEGILDCTIAPGKNGLVVHAAYVSIPSRGKVAATHVFDSSRVSVDMNDKNQVIGIEFLARKTPKQLPGFLRFVGKSHEGMLLAIMAGTAMDGWERLENAFSHLVHAEEPWTTHLDKDLLAVVGK